ncbi:hypothetical protein IQ07DRAFT_542537 [Pyrenochaeta sp. DS3sAY3a]|nr:hypothetical protein IQ07DRAFT_542537 [Pyrenochaeta sp. DS3sAY3a]
MRFTFVPTSPIAPLSTQPHAMAAEDAKGKKRKSASSAEPKAKKPRKADETAAPATASKVVSKGRKQAADAAKVDDAPAPKAQAKPTKAKKSKDVAANGAAPVAEPVAEPTKTKTTKPKKSKKAEAEAVVEEPAVEAEEAIESEDDAESVAEEDDQTAALLAGFDSDGDSEDPEDDLEFDEDIQVPTLSKKQKKALEKAAQSIKTDDPGVIYVGRVPRGFFEAQMKKYFSQFGKVNRLRLSRNKKTGASKHYAFVEFASSEVADIVARTMNNYLMFGHILKCHLVPAEQVHPDLFKGAGERFKVDPRNKKAGLEMERGVDRTQWEKRVEKENKRRSGKNKQLKEDFGYEYGAPQLKAVEEAATKAPAIEAPKTKKAAKAAKAVTEASPSNTNPVSEQKAKKNTKAKAVEASLETAEPAEPVAEKKGRKPRKAKADVPDATMDTEEAAPVEAKPKSKKAQKESKADTVVEDVKEKKRKAKPESEVAAKPKKAKKAKA